MDNNNNANPDDNTQNNSSRSKQIMFILVIYLMLVMSSKFGNKNEANIFQKTVLLLKTDQVPPLSALFGIFESNTIYHGYWEKVPVSDANGQLIKDNFAFQNYGKSKVEFAGVTDSQVNFKLKI